MTRVPTGIAAVVASAVLSGCAATPPVVEAPPAAAAEAVPSAATALTADQPSAAAQRDLTSQEKKIIMNAVAPALRDPATAKYKWTTFPLVPESDTPAYCATVNAKSPHAAYSGKQAYIVDVKVTGGHITAAALGLIAGGKDASIVADMCAQHGLDPSKAT